MPMVQETISWATKERHLMNSVQLVQYLDKETEEKMAVTTLLVVN